MLKTFGLRGREVPMTIYGPPGLQDVIDDMDTLIGRLPFDVDIYELEPGEELGFKGYTVSGFDVTHRGRAFGFKLSEHERPGHFDEALARELGVQPGPDFGVLQRGGEITVDGGSVVRAEQVVGEARRGRTIVYTGDTAPCAATVDAAKGADLLVHESTFGDDEADRAKETQHSTARQAAEVARDAGVEMLCLTHVSGRYFGKELREQAREVFPNTELPRDFDVVELPFPERGTPILVKED
jgi:ribonuclease Z